MAHFWNQTQVATSGTAVLVLHMRVLGESLNWSYKKHPVLHSDPLSRMRVCILQQIL